MSLISFSELEEFLIESNLISKHQFSIKFQPESPVPAAQLNTHPWLLEPGKELREDAIAMMELSSIIISALTELTANLFLIKIQEPYSVGRLIKIRKLSLSVLKLILIGADKFPALTPKLSAPLISARLDPRITCVPSILSPVNNHGD